MLILIVLGGITGVAGMYFNDSEFRLMSLTLFVGSIIVSEIRKARTP